MNNKALTDVMLFVSATFPLERLRAALVFALCGTWLVCGVFGYLARHTNKSYYRMWTVAWLYYSLDLVALLRLGEWSDWTALMVMRQACLGISAVCLFWGNLHLHLASRARKQRELVVGLAIVLAWSYVATCRLAPSPWIAASMFLLLASAGLYTAALHLRYRKRCAVANWLTAGVLLWSLHLVAIAFPKLLPPGFLTVSYLFSGILGLFLALGMLMLSLEQARERNDQLYGEFKKGATQRRLLEQEISVSEQKYRALFDSASDAIFLMDFSNFEIVEANDAAAHLIGCEIAELVGSSFVKLCPRLSQAGSSLLENKKLVEDILDSSDEFFVTKAKGDRALCEGGTNLVQYHKRPVLQINVREITERKKMEQQIRQTEKLTALGQLVAGVAHELNNPLAVVMGYAQILAQHPALEEKIRKDMSKILHESDRAAKIVRNLLTFARPCEPCMVRVDVNRLVSDALDTREIQLQGASVRVVRRLARDLPPTMADPNQIEQVLANLVTNALQAVENHQGHHVIEATTEERNGKVRITIADNGPGIPSQVLSKIYDPFFTTKGPGKGTGLGLSICYSIMEEHKGKIWVESEIGKGTRFYLELPLVACPEQVNDPAVTTDERAIDPDASQRRLLIVDDEPGIVDVLKEVLGSDGYRVETASNGADALKRLAAQRYDLIISDLCMPEIGGEKLYRAVSERFPHLRERIIFVTGDTVSPASRAFLEETGSRWLSKPFNIAEIERLVLATFTEDAALPAAELR